MRGGLALVLLAIAPGTAHAGRSFFGWLFPSEVMPERQVELQTWVSEENRVEPPAELSGTLMGRSRSIWGVAPLVGITDQLELVLPLEMWWVQGSGTSLHNYGAEARYRFVTQDAEEAPAFAPLGRLALRRMVLDREVLRTELNMVATYEAGGAMLAADLGFATNITRTNAAGESSPSATFELRPAAGFSVRIKGDFRLGGEGAAQIDLDEMTSYVFVGPNLSWTHGRFWVSATYGVGVYQVKNAPRMQWGIAF